MNSDQLSQITQLLSAAGDGDAVAQEQLWEAIYGELRRVAQGMMASENPHATLQPTVLVHEAYFRLFGNGKLHWNDRRHFFATAARIMRHICIDDARKRKRLKRGGAKPPGSLEYEPAVFDKDQARILAVDEALRKLEEISPRKAKICALRYYAGLNRDETAEVLELSHRAIDKDWRLARAWLHRELTRGDTAVR